MAVRLSALRARRASFSSKIALTRFRQCLSVLQEAGKITKETAMAFSLQANYTY
jgi:hypothetical protein